MKSIEKSKNGDMAQIVERNIKALLHHRTREEQKKSVQDKIADSFDLCFD